MFSRIDRYFEFLIIIAENAASYKYVVQNRKSMVSTLFEIVKNLNPKQKFTEQLLRNET